MTALLPRSQRARFLSMKLASCRWALFGRYSLYFFKTEEDDAEEEEEEVEEGFDPTIIEKGASLTAGLVQGPLVCFSLQRDSMILK